MELFKIMGKIAIDNTEANKTLKETADTAKGTSDTIKKSNQTTQNSNKQTTSSWGNLKTKVAEYKSQGMSTSQAWRQASLDMKSSTETAGNGMTSTFKRIGAAVATYLTVDAIKNFGMACITAAADAQAMESQFSQVFGDLEGAASESLSKIADEAGISENRMKGSFTKIAAFAKTTGMDTESSLALSERAMIAVADSAAFYDRSLEETTESLQSFLKGNYENDSALGLSCTEVTRNEAANKLYGKSFKDLSEAQKQLTLLQMVEDANAASGALGQAARESDTWTNVTGNLQQAWKDFQAVIGNNVLPIAINAVKGMVSVVESWTAKLPALVDWCKQHKAELAAIGIVIGAVAVAIGLYTSGITLATVATTVMTAASSALAAVIGFITSPITLTVIAIGALVAALVVAYNKSETFRGIVDKLKEGIVKGFNVMKEAAIQVKDRIVAAWDEISERCKPLIDAIKGNLAGAFDDLKKAAQGVKAGFDELKAKFQPIADFLSGAFSSAASNASGWFDRLTEKAGDLATGALSWLNDKITAARDAFNQFADFAGRLWENLDPLVTLIRDNLLASLQKLEGPIQSVKESFKIVADTVMNSLVPAIRDALMHIWEKLQPVLSAVAKIIGGVLVVALGVAIGVINGIASAIAGMAEAFSGVVEIVANVFKLIVGIFTGDGEAIKEAASGIVDGVASVFGGLWDAVSGFVSGFVDGVVGFFQGLWDTLVGHSIVPDTINGIADCFSGLWGKVSGSVSGFVNSVTKFFTNLKNKGVSIFNSLKESAVQKFNELKDNTIQKFTQMKEYLLEVWANIKESISNAVNNVTNTVSSKFGSMKSKASSIFSSIRSNVSSAWNNIKSSISNAVSGAYNTVSSKFGAIKDKISSVMESAKSIVSSAVTTLKNAFNFSWSLPHIKLPHFTVSGGKAPWGFGGEGSLPKVSVSWYKKAMDNAMILNEPTIFGYSAKSGKALGGGEAGNEVVAGESRLMELIGSVVEGKTAEQNNKIISVLAAILEAITGGNRDLLKALLSGQTLKVGEREFARLVKQYA